MKEIVVLGGPNGAGKTTAARMLLPKFPNLNEFLNADEFARAISPGHPEHAAFAAGRKMLERMRELIALRASFGLESTLSGRSYLPLLNRCRAEGWRITLLYLWLRSPEVAIERVAKRVREGGHGLDSETIRRRYFSGLSNLVQLYIPLAHEMEVYDNSVRPVRIAKRAEGGEIQVFNAARWAKLERMARCGQ